MNTDVLPVARSIVVCDAVTAEPNGKIHVSGIFNAIRAADFPHSGTRLVVFSQLTGGIGTVPTFIDIRHAATGEVVYNTGRMSVRFVDRLAVYQLRVALSQCQFPYPGLYTIELFCQDKFVCDTTVHLLHTEDDE